MGYEAPRATQAIRVTSLGECLSRKRQADVYAAGQAHVVKLFCHGTSLDTIGQESFVASSLHVRGMPVPVVTPGLLASDDGRHGLRYERVPGRSLGEIIASKPFKIFGMLPHLVGVHRSILASEPLEGLLSQREVLRERLAHASMLDLRDRQRLIRILDEAPDSQRLCHGNFEPANVILDDDGGARVMGWRHALNGCPLGDITRTALVLMFPAAAEQPHPRAEMVFRWFLGRLYVREYLRQQPTERGLLRTWMTISTAVRACDDVNQRERGRLLSMVRRQLAA